MASQFRNPSLSGVAGSVKIDGFWCGFSSPLHRILLSLLFQTRRCFFLFFFYCKNASGDVSLLLLLLLFLVFLIFFWMETFLLSTFFEKIYRNFTFLMWRTCLSIRFLFTDSLWAALLFVVNFFLLWFCFYDMAFDYVFHLRSNTRGFFPGFPGKFRKELRLAAYSWSSHAVEVYLHSGNWSEKGGKKKE